MVTIREVPPSNGNGHASGDISELRESYEVRIKELEEFSRTVDGTNTLLQEQMAELELALEDAGWQRLSLMQEREFSPEGRRRTRRLARMMYLSNPLIHHGVEVQANYVWGQGCNITAANPEVNDVVQDFLDDPKNKVSFTGHVARLGNERLLQLTGDLYLVLFTNPSTGRVVIRSIDANEVPTIVSNPEDYMEPWYYKRTWSAQTFDPESGSVGSSPRTAYYPDWRLIYNKDPKVEKPKMIGGEPVMWDSPVYHIKVGGLIDSMFGVPEVYAALNWARAVNKDLSDYATVKQAHARFAWSLATKGGKGGVAAGKKSLNTTLNADGAGSMDTNPAPVTGATFIKAEGWDLSPMKLAGTQPSPDEGRRLGLMVCAALGIPEPILFGDADVGNLATAKTLDRPTELQMENRRKMWADVVNDILNYVIDMAVICPNGELDGTVVVDPGSNLLYVELPPDDDTITDPNDENFDPDQVDEETGEALPATRNIRVTFPSLLQRDVLPHVQAIVQALTLGGGTNAGLLDDRTGTRLLLDALSEEQIDETLDELFPENEVTFNAGTDNMRPDEEGEQSTGNQGLGDMGDITKGLPDVTSPDLAMIAALRTFGEIVRPALNRFEQAQRLQEARPPLVRKKKPTAKRSGVRRVKSKAPAQLRLF